MANKFSNFTFTNEGLAVITDALANNTSLSIEQVYTFATKLTDTVVYSQLSGLSPKQIKPVGTVTAHDTTVETRVQIDNSDVTVGYNLQGVALVGTHNSVKFVIGYINANETTNIPVYDGVQSQTLSFDVSFAISDTSVVEVNVQPAGMLTVADYNALIAYVDSKTAPLATDTSVVHKTQNETIDGIKTFLKTIDGSVNGNSNSTDYINQHVISANVDLNTLTTNGNYLSTLTTKTTTNKPVGTSEQYTLASIGNVQFFNDIANDKLYLRNKITATTFTSWKQVAQLTDFGITNAVSASKLATARTIGGVSFDGTANINLPGVNIAGNQPTSGNAGTATKLASSVSVGGVSFDGSTSINLPGVNTAGNQSTTGNAGSATKLQTARTINGVSFDGTANISVNAANDTSLVHTTGGETIGGDKIFTRAIFVNSIEVQSVVPYIDFRFGNSNDDYTSRIIENTNGQLTFLTTAGAKMKISADLEGTADTATKLATSRTINGVAFDGTANISVNAANDASLVHRTGDETIGGVKTFTGTLVANNPIQGNIIRYNILDGYDLNGYKDTGDFVINGANNLVNYPDNASNYAVLHVEKLNNDTSIQTLTTTENIIYTRSYGGSPSSFGNWKIMATGTSTTINLYGKGTYFTTDSYLVMIVSGKVVSVQGTLTTKVDMSGGFYLTENLIPAQYAPSVARKNVVGFNSGTAGTKVYADVAWSINGDISIDNIVNGSNMTAWGTIPAGSQLSFADTWVLA